MIKSIQIGDKAYDMKSNLHIYEVYKNMFGQELTKTINDLQQIQSSIDANVDFGIVSKLVMEALKIAWVMIKELDDNFMPLAQWEKELDSDMVGSWINEVLTLALQPFLNRKLPQDHKQAIK